VTGLLSVLAIGFFAVVALLMFGSWALRWAGGGSALVALVALAVGAGPLMLWLLIPALVVWVLGHWPHYLQHGYYKSALVDSMAAGLPGYNPVERIRIHFD
jgi:hypothetical protein